MTEAEACRVLGINPSSTIEEAKKAFRRLALTEHPDVKGTVNASPRWREISQAHDFLTGTGPSYRANQKLVIQKKLKDLEPKLNWARAQTKLYSPTDYRREQILGPLEREEAALKKELEDLGG